MARIEWVQFNPYFKEQVSIPFVFLFIFECSEEIMTTLEEKIATAEADLAQARAKLDQMERERQPLEIICLLFPELIEMRKSLRLLREEKARLESSLSSKS